MRIGLNATGFNDRPSGAKQRFVGIYGALIKQRPNWTFVVYEPTDGRIAEWFGGAPNVIASATPIRSEGRLQRTLRNMTFWRTKFAADRLDIFENFVLPMVKHPTGRTVLTIHDIRSLYEPGNVVATRLRHTVFHHAFSRADRIIAVSNAVRDEILAFHPSASVSTVYNGVDASAFVSPGTAAIADLRRRYAVPERFVLAIGHLEARKNLGLLVEAIGVLRDAGTPRPLVIVGNHGGEQDAIRARIAALDLGGLITMIQGADDATVRILYAACDLLAFPSRYEGFGIPILEAMAAGKPMALADTPVFRELTQDKGVYFQVDDAGAAARAIDSVWSDAKERARQTQFGDARVQDFGFDVLARQIAAIYEQLV